jgi:hypothetical protein
MKTTPQLPIKIRLISLEELGCDGFLPCLGTSDGRLGDEGGERDSRPRRDATVGDKNAPEVADCTGGLNCEYDAVACIDRLGFRRTCILDSFCAA